MVGILIGPVGLIVLLWIAICFIDAHNSAKTKYGLNKNNWLDMVFWYLLHLIWTPLKIIGHLFRFLFKILEEVFD